MDVVRLLNLLQYDEGKQRFRDVVHRNSSKAVGTPDGKGGLSVVDLCCAADHSGSLCSHIERYYSEVAGVPCGLWLFDPAAFEPKGSAPKHIKSPVLLPKPSDTGDGCHRNLHNVSDNRLEKAFKREQAMGRLKLCWDGDLVEFTHERAVEGQRLLYFMN